MVFHVNLGVDMLAASRQPSPTDEGARAKGAEIVYGIDDVVCQLCRKLDTAWGGLGSLGYDGWEDGTGWNISRLCRKLDTVLGGF